MNFSIDLQPVEDKNPAITRHVILKRPQASWSQSVFSVPLGEKIMPNRDYPYEGLSVIFNGENYHMLDGIAVGVKSKNGPIKLYGRKVKASPWNVIYYYSTEKEGVNVSLSVDYYILDTRSKGVVARILLKSNASHLAIEPLVDIRHMYDYSEPDSHSCDVLNDGIFVRRNDKLVSIRTANECRVRTWKRTFDWWYKLGFGFREYTSEGIKFKGESKMFTSFGELEITISDISTALVIVSCSDTEEELERLNKIARKDYFMNEKKEEERANEILEALGVKNQDVAFRALALTKFGMYVDCRFFHEGGDFWFRTPWFRDQFEGLINNMDTFFRLGFSSKIKGIILNSFEYQDELGRLPKCFPVRRREKELDYKSADATLLAFIVVDEYLKRVQEREKEKKFAEKMLNVANKTIIAFERNTLDKIDGGPVLHENGLLTVVPSHTWTDTLGWDLKKPKYFMPEINAEWIKMLRSCINMSELLGDLKERNKYDNLRRKALRSFKEIFWEEKESLLYSMVGMEGERDKTWSSRCVVAFSLLLDENAFSNEELIRFVKGVKENLLAEKNGLPFGILVKKSPKRRYYGDAEYHEGVVWPRDTPYLIRLLRKTGDLNTIKKILENNLYHQMNEGFVFYNSELFSLDNGEMVPVKNPIQFWSQWVDPYIYHL